MKDHEKRELVDRLTKLAQEFADTQQLRARIAGEVLPALAAVQTGERERLIEALRREALSDWTIRSQDAFLWAQAALEKV